MEMTGAFTPLPEEFGCRTEEWTPPAGERNFSLYPAPVFVKSEYSLGENR